MLAKADALWNQAEAAVAKEPEVLDRVKRSRMSLDFAILERARLESKKQMPANAATVKLAAERFAPFRKTLKASPLTKLSEYQNINKDAYCRDLARDLGITSP